MTKLYATFHLLIINEVKYIDGACISVSTYREYGNKNIKHNILIDKSISKTGIQKLKKYFDNVFLVPLKKIKSNFIIRTKKLEERYGSWIDYSWAKWYILWFEKYDKVLFCDIDTLAVNNYTNVFNLKTPSWCIYHKVAVKDKKLSKLMSYLKTGDKINVNFIKKYTEYKIKELCLNTDISVYYIPINASIVLLKPSKKIFKKLLNYIDEEYKHNGFFKNITNASGPDENLLFKFYNCKLKVPVYCLGLEYLTTEYLMEDSVAFKNILKPIILNYDSTDKPWLKKYKNMYKEEIIWYKLRKKYL
jgi:hypothetical protein